MAEMTLDLRQACREEMGMHARILEVIADGDMTVPQVAEQLARPVEQVMVWMMGMRRYGALVESKRPNDDDYFTYRVAKQEEQR